MATMAMPVMSAAAIAPRSSVRAKVAIRGVRVVGARPIVARPAAVRVAASATVEKSDDLALGQVRIAPIAVFRPLSEPASDSHPMRDATTGVASVASYV